MNVGVGAVAAPIAAWRVANETTFESLIAYLRVLTARWTPIRSIYFHGNANVRDSECSQPCRFCNAPSSPRACDRVSAGLESRARLALFHVVVSAYRHGCE